MATRLGCRGSLTNLGRLRFAVPFRTRSRRGGVGRRCFGALVALIDLWRLVGAFGRWLFRGGHQFSVYEVGVYVSYPA